MADWKNLLIAIDEEETSLKALRYVGEMTREMTGVSICLLHVYPSPPPDFYQRGGSLPHYRRDQERHAGNLFFHASQVLAGYGIDFQTVRRTILMAENRTISETVLKAQRDGGYGTVVVGKRGVSKAEEFLFGSISNALARNSRDFSAWIVG